MFDDFHLVIEDLSPSVKYIGVVKFCKPIGRRKVGQQRKKKKEKEKKKKTKKWASSGRHKNEIESNKILDNFVL